MSGSEELGRPFEYDVELLCADGALAFPSIVGQSLGVHAELAGSPQRHYHGVVTRFSHVGWSDRNAIYHATLRPSLWLLTRRAGCRIFQNKSVPEIVKAVLKEYGFPFDVSLSGSYPPREYVVQYRETDFDFVSRLLEHEGIYYFFKHDAGKHTLVLADSSGAHQRSSGYEEIPFYPPQSSERRERDHIEHWNAYRQIEPSAFSLRDYDFTRPRANLEVKRSAQGQGSPELELYDFPAGYVQSGEGERYARTRLEEHGAEQCRAQGVGTVRGLFPGALFKLIRHPRQDQNQEYLVLSASYDLALLEQESSGGPAPESLFRCSFTALESRTPFRPPRATPRPIVNGPQTARVVGKSGEEIWTDKYGRVKVEFHWDRASPGDEQSSCWVRVAQGWSGPGWGAMHIPRIGQEVVVQFLDGDPDYPIIVGHLHNADNMPPYALPANQTRSGWKSRSTKGGASDNANEIRFEDKKGDEQFFVQAEKNYDVVVKNDATRKVGHDETREIKHDESHSIDHDHVFTVGNDQTIHVKANRTETVDKDESISIQGGRTESVTKDESVTISGARTLSVSKDESIDVGKSRTESIGKDASVTISGAHSESVGKDQTLQVSGDRSATVGKSDALDVGKSLLLKAGQQIVLETGSAKLTLKSDGTIQLEGNNITIKGGGNITVKGGGSVTVKGSDVKVN
jgi:type VI secretion system secreted protein VgrG